MSRPGAPPPWSIPWAAACVLAAIALAEALAPSPSPQRVKPAAPPAARATARADDTEGWSETVLARPLFNPDRRPAAAEAVGPVAEAGPSGAPRLTGIIVGPEGRTALFEPNGGGKSVAVHESGHVGPYTVRAIGGDGVIVAGPDGTGTLRPSFSTAAASTPAVPAPPTAPGLPPVPQSPFGFRPPNTHR